MTNSNGQHSSRRSSRLQINIPVLVTRVEGGHFSEVCETLALNTHGCAVTSPAKLDPGVPLHLQLKSGRHTTGQVVDCQPIGAGGQEWMLGVSLDRPGNFWGLDPAPADWTSAKKNTPREISVADRASVPHGRSAGTYPSEQPPRAVQESLPVQPASENSLSPLVAELLQPLQREVAELRQKLGGEEHSHGRFEISLSHIPAEVQDKIREHLQRELGEQVLQQSREQSAHLLQSVTATIEQKIGEVRAEFQQHAAAELHSLEQRAHSLAENIGGQVKQDISADLQNFQRQVSIAAARFDEKSGEMGRELQARLSAQHDEQKREMREAHLAAAAESSRVQERISALDDKVSKLHEAASRLELDLNAALTRTANDIVAQARGQLESAVDSMLRDLTQRNSAQVEMQLEQAGSRLKKMLAEAESSSSAVVKKEISENLQSFEQTVEEMAQHSVSRWRLALAGELESLSKLLSGQLRVEKNPEYDEERAADA